MYLLESHDSSPHDPPRRRNTTRVDGWRADAQANGTSSKGNVSKAPLDAASSRAVIS